MTKTFTRRAALAFSGLALLASAHGAAVASDKPASHVEGAWARASIICLPVTSITEVNSRSSSALSTVGPTAAAMARSRAMTISNSSSVRPRLFV